MSATILVVDNQRRLQTLIKQAFTQQGYQVRMAYDGREALLTATANPPDLIVVNILRPNIDGDGFVRAYRKQRSTPVLLLTDRLERTSRVVGWELGADAYLIRPFSLGDLVERVGDVLERTAQRSVRPNFLRVSDITLNRSTRVVTVGSQIITGLTPSEFDLLTALMTLPGRVFSRLELLERLQGGVFTGAEHTIDTVVRNLRAKIEPLPAQPRYVETVVGVGYRFNTELRVG